MANINVNRVNTTISPADETTIGTARTSIQNVLFPYLTPLVDEERASLFSLQEENLVFAYLALQQAQALGGLIPAQLSNLVNNLQTDLDFHQQLLDLDNDFVLQLAQQVSDTKRLTAHEAYVGSLAVYKIIEALASIGVAGAQTAYDILKVRFENQGGRPPQDTANNV